MLTRERWLAALSLGIGIVSPRDRHQRASEELRMALTYLDCSRLSLGSAASSQSRTFQGWLVPLIWLGALSTGLRLMESFVALEMPATQINPGSVHGEQGVIFWHIRVDERYALYQFPNPWMLAAAFLPAKVAKTDQTDAGHIRKSSAYNSSKFVVSLWSLELLCISTIVAESRAPGPPKPVLL